MPRRYILALQNPEDGPHSHVEDGLSSIEIVGECCDDVLHIEIDGEIHGTYRGTGVFSISAPPGKARVVRSIGNTPLTVFGWSY